MTQLGTIVRRNFEPIVLSLQVLVDLAVVLAACVLGYLIGDKLQSGGSTVPPWLSTLNQAR